MLMYINGFFFWSQQFALKLIEVEGVIQMSVFPYDEEYEVVVIGK